MGLCSDIIARLKVQVPALGGRVEGAMAAAKLFAGNAPPQVGRMVHVVPGGLQGGRVFAATGLFRQEAIRLAQVILSVNAGQVADQAEDAEELIEDIVLALVGWQPPNAVNVITLRNAPLISAAAGLLRWNITVAAPFELRILS